MGIRVMAGRPYGPFRETYPGPAGKMACYAPKSGTF